jgi:hypothetical protein
MTRHFILSNTDALIGYNHNRVGLVDMLGACVSVKKRVEPY